MSALFSPLTLRSVTLPNRIVVSPMCQYSAERGEATAWHMIHLGSLALSGAGLLCIEATAVEPDGRITPGDLGLWDDATEAALKPVLAAIRKHSPIRVAMQLSHAGRKASSQVPWEGGQLIPVSQGGWLPHAPSALPHKAGEEPPLALDTPALNRIREAFAASARRAARLGVDALELHAAHGYLLHQFLSPLSNQRTDPYGGSFDNRTRIVREVISAVREVWPAELPLWLRISATDWAENDAGWNIEQSVQLAQQVKPLGVDLIDVSSGGMLAHAKIPVGPGYQVPFAARIRREADIATGAVGMITEVEQAQAIIANGEADVVLTARESLRDPYFARRAAKTLDVKITPPVQYGRAW